MQTEPENTSLLRNTIAMLLVTLVLYSGYQLSNRFHLIEPRYLPVSWLDNTIPFLMWTVWPYFLLIFMAFLPIGIRDRHLFNQTMWAFTIAVSLNICFWLLFPTIFQRPPLPADEGYNAFAYRWLCSIDTPANCFPSGHITSPAIGCWALSKEAPKHKTLIWICFGLLSLTIFSTKQHYIWDLPGGLITAFTGIYFSKAAYSKFKLFR